MFSKFLVGAVVTAGAIVAGAVIAEVRKNEAIRTAGKDFVDVTKNLGKELYKSAVNITKTSVNENLNDAEVKDTCSNTDCANDNILSSDNGDIAVCAEGIKATDEIQQDKFIDADTELTDDELVEDTETTTAEDFAECTVEKDDTATASE